MNNKDERTAKEEALRHIRECNRCLVASVSTEPDYMCTEGRERLRKYVEAHNRNRKEKTQ